MILFNDWGIATLVCCIFTLLIALYLASLKSKQKPTRYLVLFFIGGFLLDFGYLWSAIFPDITSGYHRFITVGAVFLPLITMIKFAYEYIENFHRKESRIVMIILSFLSLLLVADFYYKALNTQPDFTFNGNIFNYPHDMGQNIARAIILMVVWFTVVMVRKARRLSGEQRRSAYQLLIAMLVPSLGPGIANIFLNNGTMPHGTYQQIFVILTLVGYFTIAIVFINNTVERTSFMTKIVGISVMTILLAVQGIFAVVNADIEKSFDRIGDLTARSVLVPGVSHDQFGYVIRYGKADQTATMLSRSADIQLDLEQIKSDLAGEGPEAQRIYRKGRPHSMEIFFGYRVADPARNGVYEVGIPYLEYRRYLDQHARHVAYMLLGLVVLILVLYPIFFSRTLVRPLNSLLGGVSEVNTGNLQVKIPVMVQDEIGYLSESFNSMVRSILDAKNRLQEYAETLEDKVKERTREVTEKMEEIQALKVQQDGDYYLTALIGHPLAIDLNKSQFTNTAFYLEQKKKFTFRDRRSELGGDICIVGNLRFGDGADRYVIFLNGDAMGKSMQGAGGAIVLGTAMNNIISRSARGNRVLSETPAEWLEETYYELHDIFKTFDGVMMASAVVGVINERTGQMVYFNAEHPWTVLYRQKKATFIENELTLRKLGSISEFTFKIREFQLQPGDVLICGSDGRDDLNMEQGSGVRVINEDENLFLDTVQEADGDLNRMVELIHGTGEVTDDLSLLRIGFHEEASSRQPAGAHIVAAQSVSGATINLDEYNLEEAEEKIAAPPTVDQYRARGRAFVENASFDEAARVYREMVQAYPADGDGWFALSVCLKHARKIEDATLAAMKVVELQPRRLANLLNLADNLRLLGRIPEARTYLERAREVNPQSDVVERLTQLLS